MCIFTYGQTGSGKTYTMLGGEGGGGGARDDDEDGDAMATEEEEEEKAGQTSAAADGEGNSDRGLIPRSIEQIFAARDAVGRACKSELHRLR